jgi:23S rRNA (pseudouridine1915-N3)-methyltransferase
MCAHCLPVRFLTFVVQTGWRDIAALPPEGITGMKIKLLLNSATDSGCHSEMLSVYATRIRRYIDFEIIEIPSPKNTKSLNQSLIREKEAESTLKFISTGDHVVLLDEQGKEMSSPSFAADLQKKMNSATRTLCFVCGGPYGFSPGLSERANEKISLSRMTFPHQLARIIFAEQLYRAFTILRNEPYHHE